MNVPAYILLALGLSLTLFNWLCLLSSWFTKRHVSPVFLIPAMFSVSGLALIEQTRAYWWVAVLMDYTVIMLVFATPSMIAAAWRTSSFTRVRLLRCDEAPRRLELSLHRRGHFVLRATFTPPAVCDLHGARVCSFSMVGRWQEMPDERLQLCQYRENRILILERTIAGFEAREEHYPNDANFRYDALDGVRFQVVR